MANFEEFKHECILQTMSIIRNIRDNDASHNIIDNAQVRLSALLRNCRRVSRVYPPCEELCQTLEMLLQDLEDQKQRSRPLVALELRRECGSGGRPRYVISRDQLVFFADKGFSCKDIAKLLHVSHSSVKRRLRHYGISLRAKYSQITDQELDDKVREITALNSNLGQRLVQGSLAAVGIQVQRHRVAESLIRVNEAAVALRWGNTIRRRQYSVAGPNALWHIDGNHKLIRWNFIIHGGIDGFSRMCMFLRVASNNRAESMDMGFLEGVSRYGLPSRVRCDHGLENVGVATFMLSFRGSNRGSIITGRSVHNVRIERLWRDMFTSCTGLFHSIFGDLEASGKLHIDDPIHMWSLHYVFKDRIQNALDTFRQAWNCHRLSTERGKTPEQMFVLGTLSRAGQGQCGVEDLLRCTAEDNLDEFQDYGIDEDDVHLAGGEDVAENEARNEDLFPCPLSHQQLLLLQQQLENSELDRLGHNHFISVLRFCENIAQHRDEVIV